MLEPGTNKGIWLLQWLLWLKGRMELGPWQNTARLPVEGEGRTREVLVAAIPPSPSFFAQKGCHFSVTGPLLLDLKSSVFICPKIKHVQGSMDLGLPTEYYLTARLLTTPLFFKINTMELLNPLEKSISETTTRFCKSNLAASRRALQNLTSHPKADKALSIPRQDSLTHSTPPTLGIMSSLIPRLPKGWQTENSLRRNTGSLDLGSPKQSQWCQGYGKRQSFAGSWSCSCCHFRRY